MNVDITRISFDGYEQLKAAMPKCQIGWSEQNRNLAERVLAVGGIVAIGIPGQTESRVIRAVTDLPGAYSLHPFSMEEEITRDYLALESIRFEERLKYDINVDPKSINIEIPPMMIQTLVENGIKHGISRKPEGGKINITTSMLNSAVEIRISNSGSYNEEEYIE